ELVERKVWEWVVKLLEDPRSMIESMKEAQDLARQHNHSIYDDIALVDQRIAVHKHRLSVWADAMGDGDMTRALFKQKEAETEQLIAEQRQERERLQAKLETVSISDKQIDAVEQLVRDIKEAIPDLPAAPFEVRRQLIEALNITGTIAIEDGAKVLHLKWWGF